MPGRPGTPGAGGRAPLRHGVDGPASGVKALDSSIGRTFAAGAAVANASAAAASGRQTQYRRRFVKPSSPYAGTDSFNPASACGKQGIPRRGDGKISLFQLWRRARTCRGGTRYDFVTTS